MASRSPASASAPASGWLPWLGLALVVFMADQFTKVLILGYYQLGDSTYVTSFFNVVRAHNTGAAFSFLAAAFTTWQINRRYAFSTQAGENWFHEWLRYLLAMLGGGVINYGVYALIIYSAPWEHWVPLLAVAAGSIAGLVVNFLSAKFWVFGGKRRAP